MDALLIFAESEVPVEQAGLLESLGIDFQLLIIQSLAFLLLLWVLSKFVYPIISGMIEKREATIREGIAAAKEAEKNAENANAEAEKLISKARKQASEVIASAKDEANSIIEAANKKTSEQTERMLEQANVEIEKEVQAARKALRDETIDLVSRATEKVVGGAMTDTIDKKVVASALKEANKA